MIQSMNGFNLDVSRIDALEHDRRTRTSVTVAIDGIRNALDKRAMADAVGVNRSRLYRTMADLFTARMDELVKIVYERDAAGRVNVDPISGRVLVALPWGSSGHKRWQLRTPEADTLRALMLARQRDHNPLFFFDADTRRWYHNFSDYRTIGQATAYLEAYPFAPAEVRRVWTEAVERRNGKRSNQGR